MEVSPSSVLNTPAEAELNLQDIAREAVNERFKISPDKDELNLSSNNNNNITTTTNNNNGSPSQLKNTFSTNTSSSTNSKINLLIDTLNLSIRSSMSNNNNNITRITILTRVKANNRMKMKAR